MKNALSKKKILIGSLVLLIILIVGVCLFFFLRGGTKSAKSVTVQVDTQYSELMKKDKITGTELDKALKGYEKSTDGNKTVYTKDKQSVKVETDANGEVIFISYNTALSDTEKAEVKSTFNESQMKIGDDENTVLELLKNDEFIYHMRSKNEEGLPLEIYCYGWNNGQAIIELVFTEGKLSYYKINSEDVATPATAENIFGKKK